jgi:hypothetical protein
MRAFVCLRHETSARRSVNELQARKSGPRAVGEKIAVLGYARDVQRSQAFHNGRTQSRTALLLVDGTQDEPLALQVFGNIPKLSDEDGAPCLVLCTSLTVQLRPKLVVTAGGLHVLKLSAEEAAGDQRAQATTRWWAELPSHLRRVAFDPGKKKSKRKKRSVAQMMADDEDETDAGARDSNRQRNSLDRFLQAATDILGDDNDDEDHGVGGHESSAGSTASAGAGAGAAAGAGGGGRSDTAPASSDRADRTSDRRSTAEHGHNHASGNEGFRMFSPPASAIKSPGASSTSSLSQSSESGSEASLSQSPMGIDTARGGRAAATGEEAAETETEITASALFQRIRTIVEAGDAATLTKRGVRETLVLDYGTDFVKLNKAEINRCVLLAFR